MSEQAADFLHEFVSATLGFALPRGAWAEQNWAGRPGRKVENRAAAFTERDFPEMMLWETRAARRRHDEAMEALSERAVALAELARTLTRAEIERRFHIERPPAAEPDGDLVRFKINHGYWEQLFMVLHDGYVADLMRPTAKQACHGRYVASRFNEALLGLVEAQRAAEESRFRLAAGEFGMSFGSGNFWHDGWLAPQVGWEGEGLRITRGVYAGARLFLSQLGDPDSAAFVDGAYAKQGLLDGSLAGQLQRLGERADRVLFCVPPHLAGLHLTRVARNKQAVLHLSGRLVHESWPMTLAGVGGPILKQLARGEAVAVFVQAAVFSALLGLYLQLAKRELGLPGRLYYLDLGQALDAACPEGGGRWALRRRADGQLAEIEELPFALG